MAQLFSQATFPGPRPHLGILSRGSQGHPPALSLASPRWGAPGPLCQSPRKLKQNRISAPVQGRRQREKCVSTLGRPQRGLSVRPSEPPPGDPYPSKAPWNPAARTPRAPDPRRPRLGSVRLGGAEGDLGRPEGVGPGAGRGPGWAGPGARLTVELHHGAERPLQLLVDVDHGEGAVVRVHHAHVQVA